MSRGVEEAGGPVRSSKRRLKNHELGDGARHAGAVHVCDLCPMDAAGPNPFRRVGQRPLPKSMTARVSSRAREAPPFRRLAIQKAGSMPQFVISSTDRCRGQSPHVRHSLFTSVGPRVSSIRQGSGINGVRMSVRVQRLDATHSTALARGVPQLGRRLLGSRPTLSSPKISSPRRLLVCATDDRWCGPSALPTRPARASCRSCVPCAPAKPWLWATTGSAGTWLR